MGGSMIDDVSLWGAVLARAIRDLKEPSYRDDALAWIESDRVGEGSFKFVADVLQTHPDYLRRKIAQWDRQRACSLDVAA